MSERVYNCTIDDILKIDKDNSSWWPIILFHFLENDGQQQLEDEISELRKNEIFKKQAKSCAYLELLNDGRMTEWICHHPERDNPADWIICHRCACPEKEGVI